MQRFLVIQTAFIGDVILATALVEKLHSYFPDSEIHFLLRRGNEGLLSGHPWIQKVIIWDKENGKLLNLWKLLRLVRQGKYAKIINVQRFASTGFLTAFSGAEEKIGFDKNPFSFLFTRKVRHNIGDSTNSPHEVERNMALLAEFTDSTVIGPRLYPSVSDESKAAQYKGVSYITLSPASVRFTKQYPAAKWVEFINKVPATYRIYLLGSAQDAGVGNEIIAGASRTVVNLCGQLSLLQSAALMKDAIMNYVNDSAPMHLASAVNAPVTAIYCSTIPSWGFGPLSDRRFIVETCEKLSCRPCTLHGRKSCPLGHFNCAYTIRVDQLLSSLPA